MKILIADDDKVMLGLLRTLIEMEGDQVATVTRPEQIIPAAIKEQPAMIVMDYHLAGGDVMETLVLLKNSAGLQEIPVLVASGMDHEVAYLRAGAEAFLLKPFRPAHLLEEIRRLTDPDHG
jgi:DNA-binding response OmpR family regulator